MGIRVSCGSRRRGIVSFFLCNWIDWMRPLYVLLFPLGYPREDQDLGSNLDFYTSWVRYITFPNLHTLLGSNLYFPTSFPLFLPPSLGNGLTLALRKEINYRESYELLALELQNYTQGKTRYKIQRAWFLVQIVK